MTDLDTLLDTHAKACPAPATNLADRILTAAEAQTPANDRVSRRSLWTGLTAVAAVALAGIFILAPMASNPTDPVDTQWQTAAEETGFADLYAWTLEES